MGKVMITMSFKGHGNLPSKLVTTAGTPGNSFIPDIIWTKKYVITVIILVTGGYARLPFRKVLQYHAV